MAALPRDITGYVFGRLKVRKASAKRDGQGNVLWLCDCKCGGSKYVTRVHLRRGQVVSCGCAAAEQRVLAMTNHREVQEELKDLREVAAKLREDLAASQREAEFLAKCLAEGKGHTAPSKDKPVRLTREMLSRAIPDAFMAVYD